jgi:hypothetical protein
LREVPGGKVADHEGAWLSGVKGARFGMMPLEKGVTDRKWYVKGIGPVRDGAMLLVSYGKK